MTSLNTQYFTVFVGTFVVFSVIVGFAIELLSYSMFRDETKDIIPKAVEDISSSYGLPTASIQTLASKCLTLWGQAPVAGQTIELTPGMVWTLVYYFVVKGLRRYGERSG